MSESRADRLRQRREESRERAEPAESGEPDGTSKPPEPSETVETGEPSKQSVKDEQVGRYMYLPESQNDRVDNVFRRLQFHYGEEYGEGLEKNRHYFPLVVRYGLDELDGLDASAVRERLESMGLLD